MALALINGTVIDGTGGAARRGAMVVIDGTNIAEVSQQREFGSGVCVVDLGGKTVMPGLIDCHMHFAPWGSRLINYQARHLGYLAGQAVHALKTTLEVGVTASRDLRRVGRGVPRRRGGWVDRRAAATDVPGDHLTYQRHSRPYHGAGAALAANAGHPCAGVQRPLGGVRQGARGAAPGGRRHQDRQHRRGQFRQGGPAAPGVHAGGDRGHCGRGAHGGGRPYVATPWEAPA